MSFEGKESNIKSDFQILQSKEFSHCWS